MIFVIVPLGKEAKQVRDWLVRVLMYIAASTVGAGLLALLLGLLGRGLYLALPYIGLGWAVETRNPGSSIFGGSVSPSDIWLRWSVGALGIAALLYALHELNILHLPNPQVGWQVPKSWMRWGVLAGNILYGLVLGTGVFTFIPFASFYILLAWELLVGAVSLQAAVALGMAYGAVRGVLAVLGGISVLRGTYPIPLSNWLLSHLGWWHAVNGLALLLVGGFLVGSLVA